MGNITRINESCHTYHTSHIMRIDESCHTYVLQCAVCCSVLQCVAEHTYQWVTSHTPHKPYHRYRWVMSHVFVAVCSVLQCVAVRCSALQWYTKDITHINMLCDSFEWVMSHMDESCHTNTTHVTHCCRGHRGIRHKSFTCDAWETWLIRMWGTRHASFICETWLIHMWDMRPS